MEKKASVRGDLVAMKDAQKELNYKLRVARRKEREKFEIHCSTMNSEKNMGLYEIYDKYGSS